jgi:hypothetical protein
MSKNKYVLVNPKIKGSIKTTVESENAHKAANKLYKNLSEYMANRVGDFDISIQNEKTNELSHYRILEDERDGQGYYKIYKYQGSMDEDIEKQLLKKYQSGGNKGGTYSDSDSSDSDSDSSTSNFSELLDSDSMGYVYPVTYYTYYTLPYYKLKTVGLTAKDRARFFVPNFIYPLNPCVEINLEFSL